MAKETIQDPLRSDVEIDGGSVLKERWPVWIWVLIAFLVLMLLGLGAWAGLRSRGDVDDGDDKGIFGTLPLTGDRAIEAPKTSGLSGRECEEPDRRAIGVMLAGDPINRPVSGFADADQVWEMPVLVSGVTRLMAVYQCGRPDDIGSVRSARHDYLFLAEGVDAILSHWGGSYHALNRVAAGEFQTMNALTNPFGAFFRKNHLPAPYNGFTTYDGLWNALQKLGYRAKTQFEGYEFKDDAAVSERGAGGTLRVAWPGAFAVSYEYDPTTNRYQRFWAGVKQVDGKDNATSVAPSVVVVVRAANGSAEGPGGYNDVAIEGSGAMTLYQDGRVIEGTWAKNALYKDEAMSFTDGEGKSIVLTRGQVWVMAVDPAITVTWEAVTDSAVAAPTSGQ